MPSNSSMRQKVTECSTSDGGYVLALTYINSQIEKMERKGGADNELMEARVLRAEVLQKLGNLYGCQGELKRINVPSLTKTSSQGYLLIKAKILMQQGNMKVSNAALQSLQDKLGHGGSSDIYGTYLWRQAFILGVLGENRQSKRLADEHKASNPDEGFHKANNVIYAQILPALASGESISYTWRNWIGSIRQAGTLYSSSTVGFASGRLSHRGKSLCQALLAEAFVLWVLGNRFNSYRIAFIAALLLKHWKLNLTSEGVGEIVALLDERATGLIGAIRHAIEGTDDVPVTLRLSQISDFANVEAAYTEAVEIAVHIVTNAQVADIYNILDERR